VASKYRARLAASGKISSTTATVKQIKFCIKAELFRNSSAFEKAETVKGRRSDGRHEILLRTIHMQGAI
jgi:hypothetical protein